MGPFGLCLAPLIFTRVTKVLKSFLHARGIRSIWYLDDILIIGRSKEECAAYVDEALQMLRRVGFIVNLPKSSLTPAVSFRFLGLLWNTVEGVVSIDEDKRHNLRSRASSAMASRLSCHDLQVLLGHLASVIPAIPLVRPTMDRESISSSVPCSTVVSPSGGLSPGSVDGRLGHGLGDLLPGVPSPGPLVRDCRCPSPYQCEGTHGPSHLPSGLPSPIRLSAQSRLEDGQFHGSGVHQKGRWHSISPSPSSDAGHSPSRPSEAAAHSPDLRTFGGESPSGQSISFRNSARLASPSVSLPTDRRSLGASSHRSLRNGVVSSGSTLLRVGARASRGRVRRV